MDKLLYRVEEACMVTGIGRSKLYDEIAKDRLKVVRFGKSVRIPASELRAYVDRAKVAAGLLSERTAAQAMADAIELFLEEPEEKETPQETIDCLIAALADWRLVIATFGAES